MRVCLFEDNRVLDLEPLTLTRPALSCCAAASASPRSSSAPSRRRRGAVVRPHLAVLTLQTNPALAVNDRAWLASGGVVLVNSPRRLPPARPLPELPARPCVGLCDDEIAYVALSAEQAASLPVALLDEALLRFLRTLPVSDALGQMGARPVGAGRTERRTDRPGRLAERPQRLRRDDSAVSLVGPPDRLWVDPSARIDPHVVADTTRRPGHHRPRRGGDRRSPGSRGPCYVGRDTQLFRANLRGGMTLGPNCRIGGEVEATIVHGTPTSTTRASSATPTSASGSTSGRSPPTATCATTTARSPCRWAAIRCRPGRPRSAASSATTPGPGWARCSTPGTAIGVMCNVLPAGPLLPKHVPSFADVWNGSLVGEQRSRLAVAHGRGGDAPPRPRAERGARTRATVPGRCSSRPRRSGAAIREAEARRLRRGA